MACDDSWKVFALKGLMLIGEVFQVYLL